MARLEICDSGILYINTNPAYTHIFASHSHPVQLSSREFLCTYQRGAGMYAADMKIALMRSLDGGVTWAEAGYLWDGAADELPYSYHDGFLSRLAGGRLAVLTFRVDRSQPERPLFSPSGGLAEVELLLFFSEDGGRTWTPPQPVRTGSELRHAAAAGSVLTPASNLLELADGRWMATFDEWPAYDDPGPYRPRMWAYFSSDEGRTWPEAALLADGQAEGKGFWHGKTIRLADDRLYTLFWAARMTPDRGPVDLPLHYAYGDPTGRHWTQPAATDGVPGQTNWPAQLPGGRLAAIYTWREAERPGFMAVLSEDDGRHWDLAGQLRLWDATGWTHLGISSPERYPHSHDTIAFGAPILMATLEGELYASWWCTYASLTHIRWARLRAVD
jgi:hypothetical protein